MDPCSRDDPELQSLIKSQVTPLCFAASSLVLQALFVSKVVFRESKHSDNDLDEFEGCEWKLIHADVFRPPPRSGSLCFFFGWGVQLFLSVVTMLFLSIFSPKFADFGDVGGAVESFVKLFLVFAAVGAFFAGRMFKSIGSKQWKTFAFKYSSILPVLFGLLYSMAEFSANEKLGINIIQFALVAFANFVLSFAGVLAGLKTAGFELSNKVNLLPRQVPPYSWVYDTPFLSLSTAFFTFIAMLSHFYSFLSVLWRKMPACESPVFVLVSIVSMVVVSMNVAIFVVFIRLSKENYRWWWLSAFSGLATAIYYVILSIGFMFGYLESYNFSSKLCFLFLNLIIALGIGLINSSASFIASFYFVQYIYNSLKME